MFFEKYADRGLLHFRTVLEREFGRTKVKAGQKIKRKPTFAATINRVKNEVLKYLLKNNFTLETLYNILRGRNSQEISLAQLQDLLYKCANLSDLDVRDLFDAIDKDGSRSISLLELQEEFADLLCLEAFQNTSAKDLRALFSSVDKNNSDSIEVSELSNLLELTGKSRSRAEAELIFQVIDHQHKGAISFSMLNDTLAYVAKRLNTPLFIKPADLIMPLITKVVKKRHQNGSSIWEHYKN